jgi:cytochrome P450
VSKDLLFKFAVPDFAMGMTERTKKIQLAFEELQVTRHSDPLWHIYSSVSQTYVREMIVDRGSSYRDYSDLFSNLLAANENDSEGLKLTDEELTGNIFIFLIGECRPPCP